MSIKVAVRRFGGKKMVRIDDSGPDYIWMDPATAYALATKLRQAAFEASLVPVKVVSIKWSKP